MAFLASTRSPECALYSQLCLEFSALAIGLCLHPHFSLKCLFFYSPTAKPLPVHQLTTLVCFRSYKQPQAGVRCLRIFSFTSQGELFQPSAQNQELPWLHPYHRCSMGFFLSGRVHAWHDAKGPSLNPQRARLRGSGLASAGRGCAMCGRHQIHCHLAWTDIMGLKWTNSLVQGRAIAWWHRTCLAYTRSHKGQSQESQTKCSPVGRETQGFSVPETLACCWLAE